jgi:transcriptional regulator with XRE-family HTH domain
MDPDLLPPAARALKRLREERNLTQAELATRAGLHVSMVFQMEQGRRADPRLSTLKGLAQGLGMALGELAEALAQEAATKGSSRAGSGKRRRGD